MEPILLSLSFCSTISDNNLHLVFEHRLPSIAFTELFPLVGGSMVSFIPELNTNITFSEGTLVDEKFPSMCE
jgi:hypothetical protein